MRLYAKVSGILPTAEFSCSGFRTTPASSCAKLRSSMPDPSTQSEHVSEVDNALLDAELFLKYQAPDRAIKRLRTALEGHPRSILLRERLREICIVQKEKDEAARQGLALARLYIERDDFDNAYDRLLEAKQLDTRINIAGGLEAIRRARRPDLRPDAGSTKASPAGPLVTLAGDLSAVSVFDAIQVIENARLTGALLLTNDAQSGSVFFNEGRIVDAEGAGAVGETGFRHVVEITTGSFEFQKSAEEFPAREAVVVLRSRRQRRQLDREGAALSQLGSNGNFATVRPRQMLHDCQAEANATLVAGTRAVDAIEPFE
jgi:hypothetical protein